MKYRSVVLALALVMALAGSACGVLMGIYGIGHDDQAAHMHEDDHDADHEHNDAEGADHEHDDADHEHSDDAEGAPVPNNGAVVRIVSPADGATVSASDFVVEIETENFTLGADGNHWHVYIDGVEWGMIMGVDTSFALNGIEPGVHQVDVRLSNGMHEELAEGDTISVTVQ